MIGDGQNRNAVKLGMARNNNLMLDGGIEALGGTLVRKDIATDHVYDDLWAFEECLKAARSFLDGTPKAAE